MKKILTITLLVLLTVGLFVSCNGDAEETVFKKKISKYTVNFDMQGHGAQIAPITNVISGSKISAPADPTADYFTFDGWYKNAECTTKWDFAADVVTKNITLYSKWISIFSPVASIGDSLFFSLADAVAKANEAEEPVTILMLNNVTETAQLSIEKSMTLNLNGKTISNALNSDRLFKISSDNIAFTIDGTITGSKLCIPGENPGTYGFVLIEGNNDTLTVNGGMWNGYTYSGAFIKVAGNNPTTIISDSTMESNYSVYVEDDVEYGSLTVNGGSFTMTVGTINHMFVVSGVEGKVKEHSADFNNVTMSATGCSAVYSINRANVFLNNCVADVYSYDDTLSVARKGIMTINGGTYTNHTPNCDNMCVMNTGGKIYVNSGSFIADAGFYLGNTIQADGFGVEIYVNGGDFTCTYPGWADGGAKLIIPGLVNGQLNPATFATNGFNNPLGSYRPVEEGYQLVLGDDGKYHVEVIPTVRIQFEDGGYTYYNDITITADDTWSDIINRLSSISFLYEMFPGIITTKTGGYSMGQDGNNHPAICVYFVSKYVLQDVNLTDKPVFGETYVFTALP